MNDTASPRRILVTSALPYANGPIHIGHLVEYIQTDIWVRFQKSRGQECYYLCADDAHGTPIMLRAEQDGITPEQLIERIWQDEAIPLAARIFAVADVFDALCSKRPYKEPMGFDAAMDILAKDTGSHFDPGVMAVFTPLAREIFDRLAGCDEEQARKLLQGRVRFHFGM